MVWACDEMRGTLRRKEGGRNESKKGLFYIAQLPNLRNGTVQRRMKRGRHKRRWLAKVKYGIKEKGLSADEVNCTSLLHGGVCRRTSTPHKSGNKIKEKKKESHGMKATFIPKVAFLFYLLMHSFTVHTGLNVRPRKR